jgi:predicted phage tail protein
MTLRTIHLHGALRERFGPSYRLDVASAGEAGRALAAIVPGFRAFVMPRAFRVIRGPLDGGMALGPEDLGFRLGRADLHIVPVVAGAGGGRGGAAAKIVIGVLIVAAAVAFAPAGAGLGGTAFTVLGSSVTYGSIALVGVGLALAGISQMLAPTPKAADFDQRNPVDQRPSFLFNGSVNMSEQGGALPLCYGTFWCGSVVVSAGLEAESFGAQTPVPPEPDAKNGLFAHILVEVLT